MGKFAIVYVSFCDDCPHIDDMGRCSLLDKGNNDECWGSSIGVRKNCPLPDATDELLETLKKLSNNTIE